MDFPGGPLVRRGQRTNGGACPSYRPLGQALADQIVCRRSDLVGTGTCCTEEQVGEEEMKGAENTGREKSKRRTSQ